MINRRAIKNGQSRETTTIGYTRPRQIKQKRNTRWAPLCENKHKQGQRKAWRIPSPKN